MRRGRLLFMNKSKVERLALMRQLAHAPFRVDTAGDFEEALAYLQSVRYLSLIHI